MAHVPDVLPDALLVALRTAAAGDGLVVVGGYLRDRLLGRLSPDLDLAVATEPATVARRLAAALNGVAFPLSVEQAIHRVALREPVASVRHIDVAALRGDAAADMARRDYTINAIAWSLDGMVIDPLGGLEDLRAGRLRLVRESAVRDDPLRALRAVRLHATHGFTIEEYTAAIIRRDAALLAQTAGERRRDELMKVLETPVAAAALRVADGLGLLEVLFPELRDTKGCTQPKEHYWDVFDHLIETVAVLDRALRNANSEAPWGERQRLLWSALPGAEALRFRYSDEVVEGRSYAALLKLTGLLHDISKPETRAVIGGRIRFFGHDDLGAKKSLVMLERLRFTNRESRLVELLIREHMRPGQLAAKHSLPTRRALYRFFRDLGDAAPDLLLLNLADHAAARGPRMTDDDWAGHTASIRWIIEQRAPERGIAHPPKLVDGHDIVREVAVPPGPLVGAILESVREAQAGGRITTREGALRLAQRLAQEAKTRLDT